MFLKNYSGRQISLPLGSLARVRCRQPQDCFFARSFPTPRPFTGEGALPRVNLRAHLRRCQGSAHPSRGYQSPHGGQGLGHFVGTPVPPALSPPSGGHAPTPPPRCPRPRPEPGAGLAGSRPRAAWGLGPGARSPRFGLRSPGSPCRTASSAPPPTYCLPPWGLPPGPSEPEGPSERQAPGRRRYPARLSGPRRRRLHRPLASSAPVPAPPQPLARPRGQDITWQPHTSGAGLRAPPQAPAAHARPLPANERTRMSSSLRGRPRPASRQE